jgi:hypothetical protein
MFLLVALTASWSETMYAIAVEFGLRQVEPEYRTKLDAVFSLSGDSLDRTASSGSWLSFIERPPYNVKSFHHWHFTQTPLNESQGNITRHHNEDDLMATLQGFQDSLFGGVMTKPWAFSFGFKSFLALVADVHSIFHLTELFRHDFPDGDDNARLFNVSFDGSTVSLLSVWESACGLFPQSPPDWAAVDATVAAFIDGSVSPYGTSINWTTVAGNTTNLTRTFGYANLNNGDPLTPQYIANCRNVSTVQLQRAAWAVASVLGRIAVPVFDRSGWLKVPVKVRALDVVGWTLFALLLPATVVNVYRRLHYGGILHG